MRTTITLADDVTAAVERLRKERGLGLSEALNELVRSGLRRRPEKRQFRQQSQPLGLRVDVTDVAEAIELLDGPAAR
ncbi:MAG: ribbon-helix-helix protein, CopG family [Actinobacteria bacterium]|nr:ribbon-helix-helix protein, CopG family [Actinomycetota bacterium]